MTFHMRSIYLFICFIESNCFRSLSNLLWNDQHNETTFSVITAFIKPCALMAGMSQTSCLCQCIDVSQQINISHCYRWIDSSQRGEHPPINRCILTSISSLNVVLHLTHLINGMFVWCGHSMARCGTPQFRKNWTSLTYDSLLSSHGSFNWQELLYLLL